MSPDSGSLDVGKENYMSIEVTEALDDEDTVGYIDGFDAGPHTVTYEEEAASFRLKAKDDIVGDRDSRIFVASDGGDLEISYGPQFDATIVTNLKKSQLQMVISELRKSGDTVTTGDFTVHFDNAGPIVFENDEVGLATCPMKFPWQWASHDRPRSGPCGPSIRGGSCE